MPATSIITFQYYGNQSAGNKLLGQYQIDFPMDCEQSVLNKDDTTKF